MVGPLSKLAQGGVALGLWQTLPGPVAAEIAGWAGFDWLLLDGEHGPWDPADLRARLIAAGDTPAGIRVPANEPWLIKQALDLGPAFLMVPMVDSAAEAAAAVSAARYPPAGIRGDGAYVARAARWGRDAGYVARVDAHPSVWAQAESVAALEDLEAICATDGVACVFLGPADLAHDMGVAPGNPSVAAACRDAIRRIRGAGVAAGIFAAEPVRWIEAGANVVSMGCDATMLASALAEATR